MIPFGELAPDVADLNTQVARVAHNVIPDVNSYAPLPSLVAQSSGLDSDCKGAITVKDNANNNYVFAGDSTKLYFISASGAVDYSKSGGYTENEENWNFIKWGNQVIASKMGDAPQVINLGVDSHFSDLSGSPPQARTLTTTNNFIVTGNTFDTTDGYITNRVRWSGFKNAEQWSSGTNQSDWQDLEGRGGLIKRIVGGEFAVIFQERSIWRMSYVGTPLVFQFDEVAAGMGTPAGGSVVQHGENIYYLAQDGFYTLQNGTNSTPIGVNKVDNWFYRNVNQSFLNRISGAISPEAGFVVWSYPSVNSLDGTPDSIIAYNYKSGRWATGSIDSQFIFQGSASAYSLEELDVFGTVDSINTSFDSSAWQGGSTKLAAFNTDNRLCFFSGPILSAELETAEFSTDMRMSQINSVRPLVNGDCTISIKTRDALNQPAISTPEQLVDADGKANFRTYARFHRVKVTTTGNFSKAIGVEIDSKLRGKR